MTKFIDAEYVLAVLFVAKAKKEETSYPFLTKKEVIMYNQNLQKCANQEKIDAVFLVDRARLANLSVEYKKYFNVVNNAFAVSNETNLSDLDFLIELIPQELKTFMFNTAYSFLNNENN